MQETTTEILLRQPAFTLELLKSWDAQGEPSHAFVMHHAINGKHDGRNGVNLLMGKGHDVSRREMHYALYLFQRFHLNNDAGARVSNG